MKISRGAAYLRENVKYAFDERDALSQVIQSPSAWSNPDVDPTPKFTTEYSYDNFGNLQLVLRA